MATNPNYPAFPGSENMSEGLNKREYFAACALTGLIAAQAGERDLGNSAAASRAVKLADALIDALNR
jgi:hypothetical protein